MKSVIGYIRCSTTKQAEEGVSLDLQKSMIENYCEINNLELVGVHSDEGISGKGTTNRTGYNKVMEMVEQAAISGVVVYSISRFGRNLVDTLNSVKVMTDNDISFLSVKENINTKTSQGRLQLNIYSSVAEYEREEIVSRIKDSLNHKKENGEKFCRAVFGLKVKINLSRLIIFAISKQVFLLTKDANFLSKVPSLSSGYMDKSFFAITRPRTRSPKNSSFS